MYNGVYVYRINFHYSFSTAVFQHSDAKRHVVPYSCRSSQVHATLALPAVTDLMYPICWEYQMSLLKLGKHSKNNTVWKHQTHVQIAFPLQYK